MENTEKYIPSVYYMMPNGQILIVNMTEEWKAAVRDGKSIYINPEIYPDNASALFPPEHVVELQIRSYAPAGQDELKTQNIDTDYQSSL